MDLIRIDYYNIYDEIQNYHRDIEILYILSGSLNITIENQTYTMTAGTYFLINSMKFHTISSIKNPLFAKIMIHYAALNELISTGKHYFVCDSTLLANANNAHMQNLIQHLIVSDLNKHQYSKVEFEKNSYEFILYLLSAFSAHDISTVSPNKIAKDERIKAIVDYIDIQYASDITLTNIANHYFMTPQYFSKYFKNNFNTTFHKYLTQVRLQNSLDLLLQTDTTILKIAMECGFSNVNSYSTAFVQTYKITPSKYRMNHQKSVKDLSDKVHTVAPQKILPYINYQFSTDESETKTFEISCSEKNYTSFTPYWNEILDIGSSDKLRDVDVQAQILDILDNIQFSTIKISCSNHNYSDNYDFFQEETAIELVLKRDLRLLLSFDYRAITSDTFEQYLKELFQLCCNKFSRKRVNNWEFELYYDSDFVNHVDEFFLLYQKTETVIASFAPDATFMAPGLSLNAQGENLRNFLKGLKKYRITQNTISLSSYPFAISSTGGEINFEKSPDSLYIENQLTMSKNIVAECNYGTVNFCFSRWIDSIGPNDVLNDSCYKAAHVIKNLIAGIDKLPSLACSLPLDSLYESSVQTQILSGLPGILTKYGIRKPLFYAYQFMEKASPYHLDHSNDYIITTNGENNYCIICHNLKTLNYKYYLDDNPKRTFQNINEYMDNLDSRTFCFHLFDIKNGEYLIKLRHINEEQGSVMNECINMNCFSSKDLGRSELQYLNNYSHPGIRLENITVTDQTLKFSTTLKPNEIKHIHIIYKF